MKKFLSLLLTLTLVLSLTACGSSESAETMTDRTGLTQTPTETSMETVYTEAVSTEADTVSEDEAAVSSWPVTVTDQAGREVTIEEEPSRLVSGYYISTSLLIALDLDGKLAGIEAKADTRPIYRLSAPELIDLPNVGTAKEFNLEGCLALEPDLVILPLRLQSAAESLENFDIPVLLINPEDQELLFETIELIAAATGTQEKAQSLLDFTSAQETRLTEALAGADTPGVYLAGNSNLLSTAGSAMYQSDMIRLAGGRNVASEITDMYWAEISYEQLLAWDPEYIILASDAVYTVEDVLADPNLADCAAVKNGNVFQIPGDAEAWDSPVPGGILGAVWLSGVLHPEECPASECEAVIDEFYETFYGFTYSEN